MVWTRLKDKECANNTEDDESGVEDHDCSSGDAVAARNGLWVTLRCRPCCAASVKPELYNLAVNLLL